MGKIVVTEFVSLDGVFEAPERWHFPFFNEQAVRYKLDELEATDALLLGRTTYDGFASSWPERSGDDFSDKLNRMPKYVVSTTLDDLAWNNSHLVQGELATELGELRTRHDGLIAIHGSGTLANALLRQELLDEVRLMVHPVVIGKGRKFFEDRTHVDALELAGVEQYDSGILLLTYHPTEPPADA